MMLLKPDKAGEKRKRERERYRSRCQFQEEVLALAYGYCDNPDCKTPALGVAGHHIIFRAGGDDTSENGIALCIGCHHIAHNGMGLRGISAQVFMVDLLTKLVGMSQIAKMRWGEKLEEIKARWNL